MTKKIWFGNDEKMMWVNCPSTNIRRGRGKWEETGGYLNGGAYAVSSPYSHRKYSIDWNLMESAEAAKIMSFYEGVYGQSPIQFVDPFAAKSNILPLHWSVPRLCAGGEAPTIGSSVPTLVNAPNDQGYPGQSAVFNLTGSATPSVQIPVPPGKNLYVGARGSATGTAAVSVTTPGGAPVLGRNLATNPSFEATSSTIEVRRNLVKNARGTTPAGLNGWALSPQWYGADGGAGNTTYVTGATDGPIIGGVPLTTYGRKTWTVVGGGGSTGWQFTTGTRAPVAAGQVFTASLYWRKSVAGLPGVSNQMIAEFYDAASGGNKIGLTIYASNAPNPGANAWQRVSGTFTVPAGATHVNLAHLLNLNGVLAVGLTVDATAALVEESPALGSYFDGSTSPDSDLTASWTGTANASPSVLTGVGVTGFNDNNPDRARRFSSQQWAAHGTRSVRVSPRSTDPAVTYVETSVGGLTVGQTYTLLGTIRLAAPQTGPLSADPTRPARGFWVVGGPVNPTTTYTRTAPNTAGAHEVRGTFVATATGHGIRLMNGATVGNGDVWWDDLAIIEGNYTGEWFDGSNAPAGYESLWEGAANASTSIYRQRTTVDLRPVTETAQTTMVLNDPGTVTLKLSGTGALTLNSMTAVIGTTPPTYTGFRQGEGNTGLRFAGEPTRTGYSSVLDLESVSAEFLEVGAWE